MNSEIFTSLNKVKYKEGLFPVFKKYKQIEYPISFYMRPYLTVKRDQSLKLNQSGEMVG